jgi:hypothetical protein
MGPRKSCVLLIYLTKITWVHKWLLHLSEKRWCRQDQMPSVRRSLLQEREESSSKSYVVLSAHSPSTMVLRWTRGSKADAVAHEKKISKAKDTKKLNANVVLSHPFDVSQWKAVDTEYPTFGEDPRNIRLDTSTDGLNLFGSHSSTQSTWPMFVWIYNSPNGCAWIGSTYTWAC